MYSRINKKYNWSNLITHIRTELERGKDRDYSHDYSHIIRVYYLAGNIANSIEKAKRTNKIGIDYDILMASCLLHDVSMNGGNSKQHHIKSAEQAREYLKQTGFFKDKIDPVYLAIKHHNSYAPKEFLERQPEKTIEAKILCDADRIDSFGAVGIVRMVSFSLKQGVLYFISKKDKLDESIYGNIKHLVEKTNSMYTTRGKELAAKRRPILKLFIEQLEKEHPESDRLDKFDDFGAVGIIKTISFSEKQGIPIYPSENNRSYNSLYDNIEQLIEKTNNYTKRKEPEANRLIKQFAERLKKEHSRIVIQ